MPGFTTQRRQRQNRAGDFGSLILRIIAPSIIPWLSIRSIKDFVARAACKLAGSPDGALLSGMSFHSNAVVLDAIVLRNQFSV
jgi:hypothetical protein